MDRGANRAQQLRLLDRKLLVERYGFYQRLDNLLLAGRSQPVDALEGAVECRRPTRHWPIWRSNFRQEMMHADLICAARLRLVGCTVLGQR